MYPVSALRIFFWVPTLTAEIEDACIYKLKKKSSQFGKTWWNEKWKYLAFKILSPLIHNEAKELLKVYFSCIFYSRFYAWIIVKISCTYNVECQQKSRYRISSYSFLPWIVSAHLCTVTFGLMYCDLWISKFKKE